MSPLTRIERGHTRAMRWMKANPGRRMPRAIKQSMNEFHALQELELQQQDRRLLQEWEADTRPVKEKGPPPLPAGRQVAIPPHLAKDLLLALSERNNMKEKADVALAD